VTHWRRPITARRRRSEMNFIAIDPKRASVEIVGADDVTDVYGRVGLERNQVDHGMIYRFENGESFNIVVYEAGLFKGDQGRYFSIGTHLYEGGAVIYAADAMGETISINHKPPVMFYRDVREVEYAIETGEVVRPQRSINGEVTWVWPEVRDHRMNARETELMVETLKKGGL
jgi:hypothetical protein